MDAIVRIKSKERMIVFLCGALISRTEEKNVHCRDSASAMHHYILIFEKFERKQSLKDTANDQLSGHFVFDF